ncbi:hypothetical protein VNO80_26217 [Phaseolus coccineus]|uniref:Uncharacterized protein n=1 Tax=Phaseolus coccineus TaxID=3886 RepID=A0AAN9QE64_PHACN
MCCCQCVEREGMYRRLEGDVSENGMESKKYAVCGWFVMLRISVFTSKSFCLWRQIIIEHIIHDVLCFLPLTCPLTVLVKE